MTRRIPLAVLDISRVRAGQSTGDALQNTLRSAREAERLGYSRFWVSEHHFAEGVAGTAPLLLAGLVAGATERIRVGTAAVLLGHHHPLLVAEQTALLEGLFPGRIDLGIGRAGLPKPRPEGAVGPDPAELMTLLLGRTAEDGERFPEQFGALRALLRGRDPREDTARIPGIPAEAAGAQLWLHGSSAGASAELAGTAGLRFGASYHFQPADTVAAVQHYRSSFRASEDLAAPWVGVSAEVLVAETAQEARRLAAGYAHTVREIRSGRGAPALPSPEEAGRHPWTPEERTLVADRVDSQIVGSPEQVVAALEELAERTGADELVVTTSVHDVEAHARSFRLLAEAWGL